MAEIHLQLLDRVQVASPCDARWEDMVGDEKVRHCAQCSLNVHNLSAMTSAEAEGLLAKHFNADGTEKMGRFCGRLFRRADGTVLTADCPVGLAAIRAKVRRGYARLAAMVVLAMGTVVAAATGRKVERVDEMAMGTPGALFMMPEAPSMKGRQPFRWVVEALAPKRAAVTQMYPPLAGSIAVPPIPPTPRSSGGGGSPAGGD